MEVRKGDTVYWKGIGDRVLSGTVVAETKTQYIVKTGGVRTAVSKSKVSATKFGD